MATEVVAPRLDRLSAEDFETASIRSAAPSYLSDAPSYHSTLPHAADRANVPAYTPRGANDSTSTLLLDTSTASRAVGLPPIPPQHRRSQVPQLNEFRIPTWSSVSSNPTARQYQNVAHRRVSAASSSSTQAQIEGALRNVLGKVTEQEESTKVRPLEDPYLVGEEAATRARQARLARENGDEILIREDRRWDWFLAQMHDWDERDRSWAKFRHEVESRSNRKLSRRIGRF